MILNPKYADSRFSDKRRCRQCAWPVRTVILMVGLLIAGCASVPRDYPRTPSTAFADYLDTRAGKLFEEATVQHPGESGFTIIGYGRLGFTVRIALTDLAEKSLDMQY